MSKHVQHVNLPMPYRYKWRTSEVDISLYMPKNVTAERVATTIPTLIFPGLGEEGFTSRRLAKMLHMQGKTAIVGVLRFPERTAIDAVCKQAPGFVAAAVNRMAGLDPLAGVHTISHSQSGGALLVAANETPQLSGTKHAIISPVGINTRHMGPEGPERTREFWKRFTIRNLRQPGQMHPANWRTGTDLTKRLVADTAGSFVTNGYNLLPHKIDYTLSDRMHEQALNGLRTLHGTAADVHIFSGMHDPVFPVHEIEDTLQENDIFGVAVHEVSGAHESLVSRLGMLQLEAAFSALQ